MLMHIPCGRRTSIATYPSRGSQRTQMLVSPQNTLVDNIWCRCLIHNSCQRDCSLDTKRSKKLIYKRERAKPLIELSLLQDSPAHTMEQNNITDKVMRWTVIVSEGLLQLQKRYWKQTVAQKRQWQDNWFHSNCFHGASLCWNDNPTPSPTHRWT